MIMTAGPDLRRGPDPLQISEIPIDTDLDGHCDAIDIFPLDPMEWIDSDSERGITLMISTIRQKPRIPMETEITSTLTLITTGG